MTPAVKVMSFPLCATALCLVVASSAEARDYGQHGTVWPVVEPDLLAQIHARLVHLEATGEDRKSTRLNSSHIQKSRMPSSA